MSIRWVTESVGYDGDNLHGQIVVNYWDDLGVVKREIDRQVDEVRRRMVEEAERLITTEDDDG